MGDAEARRVYGYRNWSRRVRALDTEYTFGRLSVHTLDHLDGFLRRNLLMMLSCLFSLHHSDIGIPSDHQFALIQILRAKLFGPESPEGPPPRRATVPLVTVFTSPVYDFLHLEHLFREEDLSLLVPDLLPPHPLVCFTYNDTLGKSWFNYTATAKEFSWGQRDQLHGRSCHCAQHPHLVPDGHQHIICPLADLVSDIPSLRHLTSMGTKFRLPTQDIRVTGQVVDDTTRNILSACDRYATLLNEMAGQPGIMDPWLTLAKNRITSHVRDTLRLGMMIRNRHPGLQHSHEFSGFTEEDLRCPEMERIRRDFVITYMDKSPNTFIAFCRKGYLLTVCDDLSPPPPAGNHVFQQVPRHTDDIIEEDAAFQRGLGLKSGTDKLPVYAAIAKLHKTPVSARFLTLSYDTSLTVLAKRICDFFAAFSPSITGLWDVAMKSANMDSSVTLFTPAHSPESWVITDSAQVISRVQGYNRSMTTEQHLLAPHEIQTFDFERLYTNLPQDDLVHRMRGLVLEAWDRFHPTEETFRVFAPKAVTRSYFSDLDCPVNMRSGTENGERYYTWTRATVCDAITYLVSHTYVTFGDRVFRQVLGIPMGTNPAVYLANFLLFSYELDAVRRCTRIIGIPIPMLQYFYDRALTVDDIPMLLSLTPADLHARRKDIALFILRQFRFTCRYIDDILTLGNAIIHFMLYDHQFFCGFQGIYPGWLRITLGGRSAVEPFLDIRLFFLPSGIITTHLYNKLREPKFADIDTCRFPHITSNLSARCKRNCLTGEFHRLRRIVLDHDNFCCEMARVRVQLELRGYPASRLRKQLESLCHMHPDLYNRSPRHLLVQMEMYYNIHHRIGLRPYAPAQLPLLPEHIIPAAAAAAN